MVRKLIRVKHCLFRLFGEFVGGWALLGPFKSNKDFVAFWLSVPCIKLCELVVRPHGVEIMLMTCMGKLTDPLANVLESINCIILPPGLFSNPV